ncbi:hypothetical protein [Caballeronia sp. dw_276]|uniref:hypothetical protein n=1 Tax=Caballeronia sp. dw_276 TaxID=2719795 RepID=UPI001BD66D21|nr:hypothetical protein [Caballeronia sp. dw_276]
MSVLTCKWLAVIALLTVTFPAWADLNDFCYERAHFARLVAEDRDDKVANQDEKYALSSWENTLSNKGAHEIQRHKEIIVTAFEIAPTQPPLVFEETILQTCLRHPEMYR